MSTFYHEGRYEVQIVQQAMTKASTGNVQFVLRFKVLRAVIGGETEPLSQQYERTSYRTITDRTMQYFERDLETLGFQGESLRELDPNNDPHASFVGNTLDFNCKHESDQKGGMREKWSIAWADSSQPIEGTPVEPAAYRQLDALFSRSKGGRAKAPAETVTAGKGIGDQRITDDDIPF